MPADAIDGLGRVLESVDEVVLQVAFGSLHSMLLLLLLLGHHLARPSHVLHVGGHGRGIDGKRCLRCSVLEWSAMDVRRASKSVAMLVGGCRDAQETKQEDMSELVQAGGRESSGRRG